MSILKNLLKEENVRQRLSALREELHQETMPQESIESLVAPGCQEVYEVLFGNEDPKVRKNVALLLGDLASFMAEEQKTGIQQLLMNSYEGEPTLFVKESYLKGLSSYDPTEYTEKFKERLTQLQQGEFSDAELKHIRAERKQLEKIISAAEENVKTFAYPDVEFELLLTAEDGIKELLKKDFADGRISASGVRIRSKDWKKIYGHPLYREVLFLIPMKRGVVMTQDNAGEIIAASKLRTMLQQLLDGEAPYRFRIDWKGLPEEHKPASKAIGYALEEASKGAFQNVPSDYEVEIQFQIRKDGTLAPFFRLPKMEVERFAYRKEAIAMSTAPYAAATIVALTKQYMKRDAQIIDPFCGVGTLLVERNRRVKAREIYGVDIYGDGIRSARVNAEAAGVQVNFINRDYFDFQHDYLFDEVITEFPDLFSKEPEEKEQFFENFFQKTKEITTDQAVLILVCNEGNLMKKCIRLHPEWKMEAAIDYRKRTKIFVIRRK